MNTSNDKFHLEIHGPQHSAKSFKAGPIKIDVVTELWAGSDPRNDIVLVGAKIKSKHLLFEKKEETLSLQYLGDGQETLLNSSPLQPDRHYLLNPGDVVRVPGATITVRSGPLFHAPHSSEPKKFETTRILAHPPKEKEQDEKKDERPEGPPLVHLLLVKLYAMVLDVFITYFVFAFVFPLVFVDEYVDMAFTYFFHEAWLKFIAGWYLLSFIQTLIFGTTLGQFIVGLKSATRNTFASLIWARTKIFLYSLLLLPGQNAVSGALFFRMLRFFTPLLFIAILASPLLLPGPFNASVELLLKNQPPKKEVSLEKKIKFSGSSKKWQVHFSSEHSLRYLILPHFESGHLEEAHFEFFDLKTDRSLVVSETEKWDYENLQSRLEYANPFFTWIHPTPLASMALAHKKRIVNDLLLASPYTLGQTLLSFGPFFGSAILVKKMFTSHPAFFTLYGTNSPLASLSLTSSQTKKESFYLFARDGLRRFEVPPGTPPDLLWALEREFFMHMQRGEAPDHREDTLLEVHDNYLLRGPKSLLTYYTDEVSNLSQMSLTPEEIPLYEKAKGALLKNISSFTKLIIDKEAARSFDGLLYQLTPMEKPGANR